MKNKDFFLYNRLGYAYNNKNTKTTIDELNTYLDSAIIKSYISRKQKTKILYGTTKDKCFLSVCTTIYGTDKQEVFIEMRPLAELGDISKIWYIITETYKANRHTKTKAIKKD